MVYANTARDCSAFLRENTQLERVKDYLGDVVEATTQFKSSWDSIRSGGDIGQLLNDHYFSLARLAELYKQGASFENEKTVSKEISRIITYLRRQVLIANALYDPSKRTGEFIAAMKKKFSEFENYAMATIFQD